MKRGSTKSSGVHSDRLPTREPPSDTGSGRPRFGSILFANDAEVSGSEGRTAPDYFHDLKLGQVVEAITTGRQEYDLVPLFHLRLFDADAVAYRQEVMRDVDAQDVRQVIEEFAGRMRTMRQQLVMAAKFHHELERQRWFLAATSAYTEAVKQLVGGLHDRDLSSRGLQALRANLVDYALSSEFRSLDSEARDVAGRLAAVRYRLLIHGGSVTVSNYDGESDYSAIVEQTFSKFQRGGREDPPPTRENARELNHVEGQVLSRVALLNPEPFEVLAEFCRRRVGFVDAAVARFDREIQFYTGYLDYMEGFRRAGLAFCYPRLSEQDKNVEAHGTFDLALAGELLRTKAAVVCNDFALQGAERVIVVTGPNQGGKTTFALAFGQLHHMAALGCPVPGREAQLFLCDRLFTQFEREEDIGSLRGKLEDDLERIHDIFDRATPNSVVILNEVLSSTTLEDALYLGREVIARVLKLDLLCVCVTFLDELASISEQTVSMVGGVDPSDPTVRTFKIERKSADGLAYALAIAEKHGVTYRQLRRRGLQ